MDPKSGRSILIIASLQAATALAALASSPRASLAAAAIGLLAVGRYASIAFFAATMGPGSAARFRFFAASAWIIGFFALIVAVAAVALRMRAALPWAVAAAFAGPVGMSVKALCSGLGAVAASGRAAAEGRAASGAGDER